MKGGGGKRFGGLGISVGQNYRLSKRGILKVWRVWGGAAEWEQRSNMIHERRRRQEESTLDWDEKRQCHPVYMCEAWRKGQKRDWNYYKT